MKAFQAADNEPDVAAHAAGVRRLARTLVAEDNADDVAQETLARALASPPRAGWPLRAWLSGVAKHVAASLSRSERRRLERERRAARPEMLPSAADAVVRVAEQRRVLDAVLALSEEERVVVVLRFFEELPPREIAHRLGVPVETVYGRQKRALAHLRARLDESHGDRRRSFFALFDLSTHTPATWLAIPGLGVFAMKKAVLVGAVVLAIGFVGWRVFLANDSDGTRAAGPSPRAIAASAETAASPGLSGRKPTGEPAAETASATGAVGPDVDLDHADRDLDLHGVVVKDDGTPAAGAAVRTVKRPGRRIFALDYDAYFVQVAGPATRTSKAGQFVIRLARGERVDLVVDAPGFALEERPDCLAGERVRIVLRIASRVVVTATDEGKQPLAGVTLRLFRKADEGDIAFDRTLETDADGRATFEGLPGPARAFLDARVGGRASPPWTQVVVPSHGEVAVTVGLPVGRTLAGRVTDAASGAPIDGASVGKGWVMRDAVTTDADGRFSLKGWSGRDEKQVHVVATGYGREARRVDDAQTLDFALKRGAAVAGRLVTEDGAGVAKARVSAIGYSIGTGAERMSIRAGESGQDGRFRLEGLSIDLVQCLIVLAEGRGRTLYEFDPKLADEKSGTVELGDVLVARARRLEGRVVDGQGAPRPRVRVMLLGANADRRRYYQDGPLVPGEYGRREYSFTDDLGRFRFMDLASGTYEATALPAGAASVKTSIEVGEADVLDAEIRLDDGWPLQVTVVDSAGRPILGAAVSLTDPKTGGWRGQARTGADGTASFTVPVGSEVQVMTVPPPLTEGRTFVSGTMQRLSAGAREARVVLQEALLVRGRVLADDQPVAQVMVVARRDGQSLATVFADESGQYEVTVPAGGPFDLALGPIIGAAGRASPWTGSVERLNGGADDVVIRARRLPADRTLVVVVLDPAGRPAKGVMVNLPVEWMGRWANGSTTDEAGRVEGVELVGREGQFNVWAGAGSEGAGRWLSPGLVTATPEGQTITVRLVEGVLLKGRIVNADGTPCPRPWVFARYGEEIEAGSQGVEDGTFSLLVDPAKLPVKLTADDAGHTSHGELELSNLRETSDLVVRLAK